MQTVGIGTRVLNFLVDMLIILPISWGFFRGWKFYVFYYKWTYVPVIYFIAVVGFLYYLIFESLSQRTPGKKLTLTKVVDRNGAKPGFGQILIRSAVRVLGVILIDSLFLPLIDKTLHDYLSKTEVVEV